MRNYVNVHLDPEDTVVSGRTHRSWDGGPVLTQLVVEGPESYQQLRVVAAPRVLRRLAEELVAAADEACRREDALSDTVLPFEAVQ